MPLGVCELLGVPLGVGVLDGVCVRVIVDVIVTEGVSMPVGVGVRVCDCVRVGVRVPDGCMVFDGVFDGELDGVPVFELDAVLDGEAPSVTVIAGVAGIDCDGLGVTFGVEDSVRVVEALCDVVLVCDAVLVGVWVGVWVGVCVWLPVSDGDDQSHVHTPFELQN